MVDMLSDPDVRASDEGTPGRRPPAGSAPLPALRRLREEALSTFGAGLVRAPVADLSYDSLLPDGRRADSALPGRFLEFRGPNGDGANVFVEEARGGLHVAVQLLPASRATLGVMRYGRPLRFVETDGAGHATFRTDPVLLSLTVHDSENPGQPRLQTSWVRL